MDCLLNVLVGGLRLFRINDVNVVIFHDFPVVSFHLVGVKNQDHMAFPVSLIVAEKIRQLASGPFHVHPGELV